MGAEIEFKFNVPDEGLEAVQAKLQGCSPEQVRIRAHYFDTPDGALASKGIVIRLRQENERWFQTAKAKGSGPLARLEHNIDLGELEEMPSPELARLQGTGIDDLLGSLPQDTAELVPVFSTEIHRVRAIVDHGDSKIEVSLDIGSLTVPMPPGEKDQNSVLRELEMELVEGSVSDLADLATEWLAEIGLFLSTVSKDARGRRLLAGWPTAVAVKAAAVEYPKRRSRLEGHVVQQLVVAGCLGQILPNATEVASGNYDHDVVHQLRVGIRRLRTALRELEDLNPAKVGPEWEQSLKRTFDALGKRRDRELLETKVQPNLEKQGGPQVNLGATPSNAPLNAAVRDTGFQTAMVELMGLCSTNGCAEPGRKDDAVHPLEKSAEHAASAKKTRRILAKRLNSLHKKVIAGGEAFMSLASDEQHRVRKQLKRLRYLAEFVGPLFDAKGATRYIKHLTPAQDALGEFNDKHVALASYRTSVEQDPKAWFAVGWLSATEAGDAQACSDSISKISNARKFWKH